MKLENDTLQTFRAVASLMHSVLALYPESSVISQFKDAELPRNWPRLQQSERETHALAMLTEFLQQWQASEQELVALKLDYGELFFGPGTPKAPLWGSVYRSPTQLLNDQSTLELKAFYERYQIKVKQDSNEPLDHLAIFMVVIAHLLGQMEQTPADDDAEAILVELLQDQLLPWAYRCLEQAEIHASTLYFRSMTMLCTEFLRHLQTVFSVTPKTITLYK